MDYTPTPDCMPSVYWQPILTYVLPPVGALLSAIALWVASRARDTSSVALLTSLQPTLERSMSQHEQQQHNESQSAAAGPTNGPSSTTRGPGSTSTWSGDPGPL